MSYTSDKLKDGGDRLLAYINMASIALLFFIWMLPETIALRHILLATSFCASLFIIYHNFPLLKKSGINMLSFCLIAEVAWKQYFESLIFFIALAASMIASNNASHMNAESYEA